MNKAEFEKAMKIATDNDRDLSDIDESVLYGCGLPGFGKRTVTLECAAKLLRWQCVRFDGSIDEEELNSMRVICRKRIEVVSVAFV